LDNTIFPYINNLESSNWKWLPFLKLTLEKLSLHDTKDIYLPSDFKTKKSSRGSKNNRQDVNLYTWACKSEKISLCRASCIDSGPQLSVFNLVIIPSSNFNIPLFGADLVSLNSGYLIAIDLQPSIEFNKQFSDFYINKLQLLNNSWKDYLPEIPPMPEEVKKYFSPFMLWSKLPLNKESDLIINDVIFNAYIHYINIFLEILNSSNKVEKELAILLGDGQYNYLSFRAEKDPARTMLKTFYGKEWTEEYINRILFPR